VKLGDGARADAALEQLTSAEKVIPDRDAREVAQIMRDELDGLMREARRDKAGALASFGRAAAAEARRPRPVARPYPVKPAGELYGEALLRVGDAASAVTQFTAALARTPRRAASLLGLARAQKAAGNRAEATKAAREFLAVWHLGDSGRPELAEAKGLAR